MAILLIGLANWFRLLRPHGGLRAIWANRRAGIADHHGHRWDDLAAEVREWARPFPFVCISSAALILGGLASVVT